MILNNELLGLSAFDALEVLAGTLFVADNGLFCDSVDYELADRLGKVVGETATIYGNGGDADPACE